MRCQSLKEWILERSIPIPESGCWIWEGWTDKSGYASTKICGFTEGVHRISYGVFKGTVPEKLNVLHKCHIPPCVNPDHLYLGTPKDNTRDMIRAGRQGRRKRVISDEAAMKALKECRSYNAAAKAMGVDRFSITQAAQRYFRRREREASDLLTKI